MAELSLMEKIVSLCKRRGFIYPASEVYGGLNGFWDYGPLGVLLKNNIRDWWWRNMVITPPIGPDGHPVDIVGLDSSIIQNPKTWIASGHVGGFSDPMSTCRQCKRLVRADHVWNMVSDSDWFKSLRDTFLPGSTNDSVGLDGKALLEWARDRKRGKRLAPKMALVRNPEVTLSWIAEEPERNPRREYNILEALQYLATEQMAKTGPQTPCPYCAGDLTEPREFNLMFETFVGAVRDEESKAYLRPETAQGIFLNFKNIIDTSRVKVPFGVAQIGKSFRNEVTPRNFIFRSREFEQMEMEWFCSPDEALKWYEFWRAERMKWWISLGIPQSKLRIREHDQKELAFYSKATADIEYLYPFTAPDFGELEGIAHRGSYDLSQHQQHSGQKLDYFDQDLQLKLKEQGVSAEETKSRSRYVPNVIEPASGLTRAVLVLLCEAYRHDPGRQGTEERLSILPQFAPIKCGVFPLVNKEGMPEIAEKLYLDLRQRYTCEYDAKQAIGRRYARMDEIGTPYCITVDGQTTQDQTVTLRERDSMAQQRVALDKVATYLEEKLGKVWG